MLKNMKSGLKHILAGADGFGLEVVLFSIEDAAAREVVHT